jgi:purine-nucleoside phosphorylase
MNFKNYFSVAKNEIKKNCIICQSFDLPLFSCVSKNGLFVKTAQIENATVIVLKNNFLAGDAVLRLEDSPCKNIIVFGSCGGCGNVKIGDLLTIDKAYNFESFTDMLENATALQTRSFCDNAIFPRYKTITRQTADNKSNLTVYGDFAAEKIIKTNSACVSSLILEQNYIQFFKRNEICAIDMESSIIMSAANKIGANVLCLFYVSDVVETPLGAVLKRSEKQKIDAARKKAATIILNLIKNY